MQVVSNVSTIAHTAFGSSVRPRPFAQVKIYETWRTGITDSAQNPCFKCATVALVSSWPAKAGHPRRLFVLAAKTWMAGPSPAMTMNHEVRLELIRLLFV
jgi:hypothetical protein